jgi:hypothetical protein
VRKGQGKRPLGETRKMRKDDITIEINCECCHDAGSWPMAGLDISGVTSSGFVFSGLLVSRASTQYRCATRLASVLKKRFRHFRFYRGV